ncbi:hypothetical protein V8G54_018983, partial [Vigna mungo]
VAGHTLGVLVGEGTPQRLYDSEGSEVLRRYELYSTTLATLLLLNEVVDFWIDRGQRRVTPGIHCFHPLAMLLKTAKRRSKKARSAEEVYTLISSRLPLNKEKPVLISPTISSFTILPLTPFLFVTPSLCEPHNLQFSLNSRKAFNFTGIWKFMHHY